MGQNDRNIDVSRRDIGALLGVLGGAVGISTLASCLAEQASPGEVTGQLAQPVSGTSIAWVNTILGASPSTGTRPGDLANSTPTSLGGATVVIAQGCVYSGDGGGGIFYWTSSNGTDAGGASTTGIDDGGTIIVPGRTGTGGTQLRVGGAWGSGR